MKKALIFIETQDGEIKKSSLEALSTVQGTDLEIATCALGAGSDGLADKLGSWGVSNHYSSASDGLATYNPETYTLALKAAVDKVQPDLIVTTANGVTRDLFPRIAAHFDMAYMSDVTEMTVSGGLVIKRPLYSGKCTAQVTFTDDSGKIVLLRPNQIPVADASGSTACQNHALEFGDGPGQSQTVSVETGESEKLDLTEAETIVSGGRGLKEAENFKLLHDLAEPLGATVGASRAVVDLGWVPHSLQVGQTGKTVAPNLYFAVGISGAIQHLAGMSGSRNIVAINKDDKAPIFQKSTYGIVGDLFEVVPLLTEKLKSLR